MARRAAPGSGAAPRRRSARCWTRPGRCSPSAGSPRRASRTSCSGPDPASAASTITSAGRASCSSRCGRGTQPGTERAGGRGGAAAGRQGVTDPGQLFEAGARAFLQGSWQRRDLALLFASGDAPPGFEVLRRQRGREWIGQNDSLLHLTDVPEDRVYAAILTSLIGEGSYEVAGAGSRHQAEAIIGAGIEYAGRLMAGGPPPRD